MGVPKFFRWISARYPCINAVIQEDQVPTIDHFFLDMNGILHTCSHPDGGPNSMPEDVIFQNIKNYTQYLVQLIRPRKTLFLAVDGVAPRAKMTQQRARRFQSAQDARKTKADAAKRGQALEGELFDPCVISPGTEFMERLHTVLKEFVKEQVSQNEAWKHVDIILSGHDCPGEGEHKIREYLSYKRGQPDYCPNERYCIYGMDADLIFLGLTTHELNMCILRENVVKAKTYIADQLPFCITYLSILREYIDCEFKALKDSLPFPYDLERIVDDWIFMAFLLGNDFIPHIPNLHIHAESLLVLWDTYHVVLPQLDGYLVEYGRLNLRRFHRYVEELSKFEQSWFEEREADHRWMRGKRGAQMARELAHLGDNNEATQQQHTSNSPLQPAPPPATTPSAKPRESIKNELSSLTALTSLFAPDGLYDGEFLDETEELLAEGVISHIPTAPKTHIPDELAGPQLIEADQSLSSSSSVDEDAEALSDEDELVYKMHRRDYYWTKLGIPVGSEEELKRDLMPLVTDYVRMLQWILNYYFLRVADWNFFYAYHYAPFAVDLLLYTGQFVKQHLGSSPEDLSWTKFDFDSQPVLPFVQQLMIMPADGAYILPKVFRPLMTSPDSPLAPFFPETFATDINGKIASWEAVVLIPFIDENILLKAIEPLNKSLSVAEQKRNQHKFHLFHPACSPDPCGSAKLSMVQFTHGFFRQRVTAGLAEMKVFYNRPERAVCADFPSLFRLQFTTDFRHIPVHVFETPSKLQSLTLCIKRSEEVPGTTMEQLANTLLGRPIRVRWPHSAVVMPVRIMNHNEIWELQDFNVLPVQSSVNYKKKGSKPLAKLTRPVRGNQTALEHDPFKAQSEADWFASRVSELERFLRTRRAILLPDENQSDDGLASNDTHPVLIFSRKLEGWSIKTFSSPQSKHNGDPQFTLLPNFVRSRATNGNQLDLSATTLGLGSSWSASHRPEHSRRSKRAAVVPAMRMEPAHGNCDGLDLDLLDLVVPGGLPPPAILTHMDWDSNQPVSLLSVFHVGQLVFVQTPPHMGRVGEVVGVRIKHGTVSVRLYPPTNDKPIDLAPLRQKLSRTRNSCYMTTSQLAGSLGLHPGTVARLTGTVLVCTNNDTPDSPESATVKPVDNSAENGELVSGSNPSPSRKAKRAQNGNRKRLWNIGLNLRRNKTHAQVLGWSRFCPNRSTWVFSKSTADVLLAYSTGFPRLWSLVSSYSESVRGAGPIICDFPREELDEAVEFVEKSGCHSAAVVPACGSYLDNDFVKRLRNIIYPERTDNANETTPVSHVYEPLDRKTWQKTQAIHCAPENLFVPMHGSRSLYPSAAGVSDSFEKKNFDLLDRVAFCKSGQTVPVGLSGTIIGMTPDGPSQTVEVMFDKEFPGATDIRGSGPCCAVLSPTTLLKLTPEHPKITPPKAKPKSQAQSASIPMNANNSNATGRFYNSSAAPMFDPPQQSKPWPKSKERKQRSSRTQSVNLSTASDAEPATQNHGTPNFKTEMEELNALLFAHKIQDPTSYSSPLDTRIIDPPHSSWTSNDPTNQYEDLNTTKMLFPRSSLNCLPSPPDLPLPPDSWALSTTEVHLQTDEPSPAAPLSTPELDSSSQNDKKKKKKTNKNNQQNNFIQKQFPSTECLNKRGSVTTLPSRPGSTQPTGGFDTFRGQAVFGAPRSGMFGPPGAPVRPSHWQPSPTGWLQPGFDPRQQVPYIPHRPTGDPSGFMPRRPSTDYLPYGEQFGPYMPSGPRGLPTWAYPPGPPRPSGYFNPGHSAQHPGNQVPLQHEYYRDYYSDLCMNQHRYGNPYPASYELRPPERPRYFPPPPPSYPGRPPPPQSYPGRPPPPNCSGRAPQPPNYPPQPAPRAPGGGGRKSSSGSCGTGDSKKMFMPPQVAKQSKKKH